CRDREAVPHRSAPRLRDHLDRPAGGRYRRRRARDNTGERGHRVVDGPDVGWYLIVAAILFGIGALGVMLRRSPLIILLSLEIMLNAANLTFVAFARQQGSLDGQIFALAVMAVAAAEVAIGLGLIVAMARRRVPLDVDQARALRG